MPVFGALRKKGRFGLSWASGWVAVEIIVAFVLLAYLWLE